MLNNQKPAVLSETIHKKLAFGFLQPAVYVYVYIYTQLSYIFLFIYNDTS